MTFVQTHKEEFGVALEHLKHEIATLRTGRATPVLVEDIAIEAYGGHQPLKALASILVSDPKTITVEPWDKSLMGAVEAGIRKGDLGFNPVNDGRVIRIPLPTLTAERRAELIKVLHQKLEVARIAIRQLREEVKSQIDSAEKAKEIGEDEKFRQYEELEKLVKETNERLKIIGEDKEKEIQTI